MLPSATVIPHGIEDAGPSPATSARRALGLDDRFVVLCFGFLAPYKGIELVLEAARRACAGDIQVVVAGGEHPRMADGRRLRRRAARALRRRRPLHRVGARRRRRRLVQRRRPRRVPVPEAVRVAAACSPSPLAHGTPVLLSPALARCAGAPSVARPRRWRPRRWRAASRSSPTIPRPLAELRRWSRVLADGRRWPAVARAARPICTRRCSMSTVTLVGAFGQGNPGDEALCAAFREQLADHELIVVSGDPVGHRAPPPRARRAADGAARRRAPRAAVGRPRHRRRDDLQVAAPVDRPARQHACCATRWRSSPGPGPAAPRSR